MKEAEARASSSFYPGQAGVEKGVKVIGLENGGHVASSCLAAGICQDRQVM